MCKFLSSFRFSVCLKADGKDIEVLNPIVRGDSVAENESDPSKSLKSETSGGTQFPDASQPT
jgi:hypothetical protein